MNRMERFGAAQAPQEEYNNIHSDVKMSFNAKKGVYRAWFGKDDEKNGDIEDFIFYPCFSNVSMFKGQDRVSKEGYWSNMVLNSKTAKYVVRAGQDVLAEGTYKQVKDKNPSLAYCSLLFGLLELDGETYKCIFQLGSVSSRKAVSKLKEAVNFTSEPVMIKPGPNDTWETDGGDEYKAPTFKHKVLSEEKDGEKIDAMIDYAEHISEFFGQEEKEEEADNNNQDVLTGLAEFLRNSASIEVIAKSWPKFLKLLDETEVKTAQEAFLNRVEAIDASKTLEFSDGEVKVVEGEVW